MKYIRQLFIILMISFAGEMFKRFLPFPIPASIYGLVILFLCLETGVLKLEAIKETAGYLIEIMPLLFIPAGAGLLNAWDVLRPVLLKITVIVVVSTIVVMVVAGRVTQFVIHGNRNSAKRDFYCIQEKKRVGRKGDGV